MKGVPEIVAKTALPVRSAGVAVPKPSRIAAALSDVARGVARLARARETLLQNNLFNMVDVIGVRGHRML